MTSKKILTCMMTRFRQRLYLPIHSSVDIICKRVEFKGKKLQNQKKKPVLELYHVSTDDTYRICRDGFKPRSSLYLANHGRYAAEWYFPSPSYFQTPVIVCHVSADQRIIKRFESKTRCPENAPNSDYIVSKPELVIPVALIEFKIKGTIGIFHSLSWSKCKNCYPGYFCNCPLEPFYDKRDIVVSL